MKNARTTVAVGVVNMWCAQTSMPRNPIAASTAAIGFLGMLVWAHHMFTTPTATVVLAFFMLSSFAIAVPTGIKIFNWLATLWRGTIVFKPPLYFAVGFLSMF